MKVLKMMDSYQSCVVKYSNYLKMINRVQDEHGFIEHRECDSLLFTCLTGTAPEIAVRIKAAQGPDYSWHRRPIEYESCHKPSKYKTAAQVIAAMSKSIWDRKKFDKKEIMRILAGSGSTISRDMLLGLAWYAFFKKDLYVSDGVIKYANDHNMVMGKGDPSRTIMSPGLLSTFAWISYRLGGASRSDLRQVPYRIDGADLVGYEAHLQILHILLRGYLEEKFDSSDYEIIHEQFERQPRNPLFCFANGDNEGAVYYLSREDLWPIYRLPTSYDRKEPWLFQRDYGTSWLPDTKRPEKIHSGGDFIFLFNLIRNHPLPR